ncbi:hypothetical protein ACU4GD_31905 [Cupriavidus basilensis]
MTFTNRDGVGGGVGHQDFRPWSGAQRAGPGRVRAGRGRVSSRP